MKIKNIKEMISNGMVFGNHGDKHIWLNKSNENEQKLEIQNGLDFLCGLVIQIKIG